MKKLYMAAAFAALAAGMTAQQLPDNGFQADWVDCVPWTPKGNTMTLGTQPPDWKISNVIGMSGLGQTQVGEMTDGYESTQAVKVYNEANSIMASQIVPGYVTLGTPWNTSVMGKQNDGGTFGGFAFGYRPDAISFMYKRTLGQTDQETNPFTVVAYTWTGKTEQADVPCDIAAFGSPTKATLTNRDRNILGIETIKGGEITKSEDFALIAQVNRKVNDAPQEWTRMEIPFSYEKAGAAPEMINVIFAAGDYFAAEGIVKGNSLSVDDVELVYYSQLSSLKVAGQEVSGFDKDVYSYEIEGDMPGMTDVDYTVLGQAASATVEADADTNIMTITVTNADSNTSHVYTLSFVPEEQPEEGESYDGLLNIEMGGQPLAQGQKAHVQIVENENGTVKFMLPNFELEGLGVLGDIVVPELTVSAEGDKTWYEGTVDDMELLGGAIHAMVGVHGYIAEDGSINIAIPVKWMMAYPSTDPETLTAIDVRFYTEGVDFDEVPMGISGIAADTDAPVMWYNLQGQRVSQPQGGVFIMRQGNRTVKVVR